MMFFANKHEKRSDVIRNIGAKLQDLGYGRNGIGDAAVHRETLASTAIDNVAMPHAPLEFVSKSCIAIYINPYGIAWDGNEVNIVFFLAINRDVQDQIEQIYKRFNDILEDKKILKELKKAKTPQDVLRNIGGDLIE